MKRPLGHLNFWVERTRGRIGWIGTISSIAVFIKMYELSPWWLMSLVPISFFSILLDKRYIAPGEVEANTIINPRWHEMMDILADIQKRLK